VFERKMQEICEVKHSYSDPSHPYDDLHHKDNEPQAYSVEEVDDSEEEAKEKKGKQDNNNKVVVDRTDVKITKDDGESWQVTNEIVTFSSTAQGAIVPYKPFDAVRLHTMSCVMPAP
jgi:hypothetical protein